MQRGSQRLPRQFRAHITNNHEYLNFIKKNHRLLQYQRNKLIFPAPIEINRRSSVFVVKDGKKQYKLQKMTNSLNKESYKLKAKGGQDDTQAIVSQKMSQFTQKKNREIGQSMIRDKQSMSDIVYNYSKYRSMEHHYKWNQKGKKKAEKRFSNDKDDLIKFPQLARNNNQIFTIEFDHEGKKLIKLNLNQLQANHEKQNSEFNVKQKSLSREIKQVLTQKNFIKKNQLHLFKKKRPGIDFGIEIKSINSKIIDGISEDKSGLQLRRQLYEIIPDSSSKKYQQLKELKDEGDDIMQRIERDSKIKNKIKESQTTEFKFVSTKQLFATQTFRKQRSQFSSSQLNFHHSKDEQEVDQKVEPEEKQINASKDREKPTQLMIKRQINRKNASIYFEKEVTVYDQKISSYKQFLFMMNLVHRKYDYLSLGEHGNLKNQQKYRYFLGKGNNSLLVKSLMKRRFWWIQEQDFKKANFSWTQLKINYIFQLQRKSETYHLDTKPDTQVEDQKRRKMKKYSQPKSPMKNNVFFKAPFPSDKQKIFTQTDKKIFETFEGNLPISQTTQKIIKYSNKLKFWQGNIFTPIREDRINEKMHNHLEFNHYIGNKKALFYNMNHYYSLINKNVFQVIPLTFHIKAGTLDPEFTKFSQQFKRIQMLRNQQNRKKREKGRGKHKQKEEKKIRNMWIVKPGQNSNRGNGIVVVDQLYSFINILRKQQKHLNGNPKTYIIQKYIQNPLLYKGRKFDIRHYMIVTRLHGLMRVYWYGEGYIRTSSYQFDLDDIGDQMIHLTNDAIQMNASFYGKHQQANKLSYAEFQRYLDQHSGDQKISFADHIYPKMKAIATQTVKSTYLQLDSNNMEHNFQIFGLDFMIDEQFDVWLIEVNTNPCLQLGGKLLGRIIPNMLEHAFRLSIDVIFPPPTHYPNSQKYLAPDNTLGRLMYELIFDEARDGKQLVDLYRNSTQIDYGGQVKQDEDTYENDGKEIQLANEIN